MGYHLNFFNTEYVLILKLRFMLCFLLHVFSSRGGGGLFVGDVCSCGQNLMHFLKCWKVTISWRSPAKLVPTWCWLYRWSATLPLRADPRVMYC